jgi:hypothetical protein
MQGENKLLSDYLQTMEKGNVTRPGVHQEEEPVSPSESLNESLSDQVSVVSDSLSQERFENEPQV